MKEFILNFYENTIFFYSIGLIASYVMLMWLAEISILRNRRKKNLESYARNLLDNSPYTPGVSIIAPAFNEGLTIVNNVKSLLAQDYPLFEVIIVNDGSKDDTLEKLIKNFDLVEVPYAYTQQIKTKPYRRMFKSTNKDYARLKVVDKVNGGTKADAINAGLNVVSYPYFINTDVDCILDKDAILNCVLPLISEDNIIAVSGSMALSNGCILKNGQLIEALPPHGLLPLFQTLEYLRSFLIGKLGWSAINAMPNVSGGFGLFRTDIVIAIGGYSAGSMAEDMDIMIRIAAYCCEAKIPYKIIQIPFTCCWTEAPASLKILSRQRTRWGRGLIETYIEHRRLIGNRKYKKLGLVTMPYLLIFELIAPIIEVMGFFTILYLAFTNSINWSSAALIFLAIYVFCFLLACVVIFYDYTLGGSYKRLRSYLWILMAAALEPFLYHPLIVFYSLKGYWLHLRGKKASWGVMTRAGAASIICALAIWPTTAYAIFSKKSNIEYYQSYIQTLYESEKMDSMKIMLDKALGKFPDDSELLRLAGVYYIKKQQNDNARYFLMKSIARDSSNYESKRMLVNIEESNGHISSAICYVNELLQTEPFNKDLWFKKIGLYRKNGNYNEAFRLQKRLLEVYPNDSIVRDAYINSIEDNYYRALKTEIPGKWNVEEAEKWLRELVAFKDNNPDLYLELSNLQLKLGKKEEAIATLSRGLVKIPGNSSLINKKASLTAQEPQTEEYTRFARIYYNNKSPEALMYLLNTSTSRGYDEDAIFYIGEAEKMFGLTEEVLYKKYRLYKRLGDKKTAIQVLEQAYYIHPDNKEIEELLATERLYRAEELMMHDMFYESIPNLLFAYEGINDENVRMSIENKLLVCYSQTNNNKAIVDFINLVRQDKCNNSLYAPQKALALEGMNKATEALGELELMGEEMPVSVYEEISNRYTKKALQAGAVKEAYRNCTQLLKFVPDSEDGLQYAIKTSNQLGKYSEEREYTLRGRKSYPYEPYFVLREASILYRSRMYKEGIELIKPWVDSLSANTEFIDAYSAHTEMWADQLIKDEKAEEALDIIHDALQYDENNSALAYTEGKAYEQLREYDNAYNSYARYKPDIVGVKQHRRKLMSVRRKSYKNFVSTDILTGIYKNGETANTVFSVDYGRKLKNDYIGATINMMSLNEANETNFSDNTGAQIKVNWSHVFNKRWWGIVNLGMANRFFPKWSAQLGGYYYHPNDIELGAMLGYKRNYFFYEAYSDNSDISTMNNSEGDLYNLKLSSTLYKEQWTLNTNCEGYLINKNMYFNVNAQAKYFPIEDAESYVMGTIGAGTAPEGDFVDKMMPNSFDKINFMMGIGCMYMVNRHVSVGITGSFHRFYNQSEYTGSEQENATQTGKSITGYKDLYNVNGMLILCF